MNAFIIILYAKVQTAFYTNTIIPMLEVENFPEVGSIAMTDFVERLKHQWIVESGIN